VEAQQAVCQVIFITVISLKVITPRGASLLPALCIVPCARQQAAPRAVAAGVVQAGDAHAGLAHCTLCCLALAAACAGLPCPVLIILSTPCLCCSIVIVTSLI
jgi:hypothetical protein